MLEVTARYVKTLFQDGYFAISKFRALGEPPSFGGKPQPVFAAKAAKGSGAMIPTYDACEYVFRGDFVKKGRYINFDVREVEEVPPNGKIGTIRYLQSLNGVGYVTAQKIYNKFEERTIQVLNKEHERLTEVVGISHRKAEIIYRDFAKKTAYRKLYEYIYSIFDDTAFPENIVVRIREEFGEKAIDIIRKNPYSIIHMYGVSLRMCDRIALRDPEIEFDSTRKERIRAGIREVVVQSMYGGAIVGKKQMPGYLQQCLGETLVKVQKEQADEFTTSGSTCVDSSVLYIQLLKLLDVHVPFSVYQRELLALEKNGNVMLKEALVPNRRLVFTEILGKCEDVIAQKIYEKLQYKTRFSEKKIAETLEHVEKDMALRLSPEQESGVIQAFQSTVTIVTGGPGTGKTSMLNAVIGVFKELYGRGTLKLAAPSGRAAKRMTEATGEHASTIHSLLGLRGDEEYYDGDPLDCDCLILDEASMIDVQLMASVFSALKQHTLLLLVGDVDQLPSVGPGNVLKDLIDSKVVPTTELTVVFRQQAGSTIAMNAKRIKHGETTLEYTPTFSFIEADTDDIPDKLLELFPKMVEKYGIDEVMLLTSYRRHTDTGSNSLNIRLQQIFNAERVKNKEALRKKWKTFKMNGFDFYEEDRVMFTRNSDGLVNGDIGTILSIKHEDSIPIVKIDFCDQVVTLEGKEQLTPLVLNYATTVHKSQGSEFACVIEVVDQSHSLMLKRNLVYTGITRAKKECIMIGQMKSFSEAILTEDTSKRKTNLEHQLCQLFGVDRTFSRKDSDKQSETQMEFFSKID